MRRIAVLINPISGTGGRIRKARERAEMAASFLAARGLDAQVFVTQRPGHAHELAAAVVSEGVATVVAWGGDGTVNEVASALAFHNATLGIVPSGSGNGLARELGIPADPARALDIAIGGRECCIDAGELDGRLFFNIAGIGLDARVAHCFAGLRRRGFVRYIAITARELFTYKPDHHIVVADGRVIQQPSLIIAIANARQYGNGAIIAPAARVDDGRLDVVVVSARSPLAALVHVPRMFMGQIGRVPDVTMCAATDIRVTSIGPLVCHLDGEPYLGSPSVVARPLPRALRVAVPADARLEVLGAHT